MRRGSICKTSGVVPRDRKRAETDIGADAEGVRQFGRAAPAGARREPVPRSAMRSGRDARAVGIERGERRFDNRFRFRPRHQRRGIDRELQAPEFLAADDARDRLARETPPRQRRDCVLLRRASRTRAPAAASAGMIERQRVSRRGCGHRVRANRCRRRGISRVSARRAAATVRASRVRHGRAAVAPAVERHQRSPRRRAAPPDARRPARR